MATVDESIRLESDNTLSFGNYVTKEKQKVKNFEALGDVYNVKTHNEVTRLEKNGKLLIETVPGSTIHNFKASEKEILFSAEGIEDTQVTLELESDENYKIYVDDVNIGNAKTNMSGKLSFSIELSTNPQKVRIEKY